MSDRRSCEIRPFTLIRYLAKPEVRLARARDNLQAIL